MFPHDGLALDETMPRISIEEAREITEFVETRPDLYPGGAAIIIACFKQSIIKWLVNGEEAQATIARIRAVSLMRQKLEAENAVLAAESAQATAGAGSKRSKAKRKVACTPKKVPGRKGVCRVRRRPGT